MIKKFLKSIKKQTSNFFKLSYETIKKIVLIKNVFQFFQNHPNMIHAQTNYF